MFFIGMLFHLIISYGQDIRITFTGTGAASSVDSVTATNLATGLSVKMPGNETLLLTPYSGVFLNGNTVDPGIVFPNPFSGQTRFSIRVQSPETVRLRIQNPEGKVLANTSVAIEPGEHEFALSAGAEGIYIVSAQTNHGTDYQKVICIDGNGSQNRIQYLGVRSGNPYASHQKMKSGKTSFVLGYRIGQTILYRCASSNFITIITDSPDSSKNYEVNFVPCTDKDGKNYAVVHIGDQTWMAENMAYLPGISTSNNSISIPYYYVYGFEGSSVSEAKQSSYYKDYGALYNFEAAKSACPTGWHLPTKDQWNSLFSYLGEGAGNLLKETGNSHWYQNSGGNNKSGFSAVAGGLFSVASMGYLPGPYTQGLKDVAMFWSSSEELEATRLHAISGWYCYLWSFATAFQWELMYQYLHQNSMVAINSKQQGFSVRCLYGGLASVSTSSISQITEVSAVAGGTISDDGNAPVTSRGVCWSTSPTPAVDGNITVDGKGTGSFTSNITGLESNTQYFVRAYAINSAGASYGSQVSFTTLPGLATLRTTMVRSISDNRAVSGGTITNDGGSKINAKGICWSTAPNPTIGDNKTIDGTGNSLFVSTLSGLNRSTNYYVRAYVTNEAGTSYGQQTTFTTADGSFIQDEVIHGYRNYGNQRWMIDNLSYLPEISPGASGSDRLPEYYVYNYNGTSLSSAKETQAYSQYGVLYNFEAAKIACPTGWYLPSDADWNNLIGHLVSNGHPMLESGSLAKSVSAKWGWTSSIKEGAPGYDPESNNSSGFAVVAAGYKTDYQSFSDGNNVGIFWSITEKDSSMAWNRYISYDFDTIYKIEWGYKANGHSVRCVSGGKYLAKVITVNISGIAGDSAQGGGTVLEDGGAVISSRGLCWSMLKNPTIDDQKTTDSSGTGSFTSRIKNLCGNTNYYVRAYATNSVGTSYGTNVTFKSAKGIPVVLTSLITKITDTTACSGGTVQNDGGGIVTARGICWSTSINPTVSDNKVECGNGTGSFVGDLIGLVSNTIYFVRAFAINEFGTSYGDNVRFSTLEGYVTYEGRSYGYQTIGSQTWMVENLAYLPSVHTPSNKSDSSPRYYVYGFSGPLVSTAKEMANYKTYGVLYNWPAAMNGAASSSLVPSGVRGVCPEGWHLPSNAEWNILINYLGGKDIAGGEMKEPGISHWSAPNEGATNSSGFTGLPGGSNDSYLSFSNKGMRAEFISATTEYNFWALNWALNYMNKLTFPISRYKSDASSVRCLKD